jgi:hypothetical protein
MIYPTKYNIVIIQGATFNPTFTWNNSGGTVIDLSSYTAAQLQARFASTSPDPPLIDLTLDAGITLASTAPNISLLMSATATQALAFTSALYNLNLTDSFGNVIRLLEGTVKVVPTVIAS